MPSRPPSTPTVMTRTTSISNPSISSAGMTSPTPNAIDSPADPVVCTMLFCKIVVRPNTLNTVMARTATGMDAEIVNPTFSTK